MSNIASFTAFAEAVTLNGLCQYDGRGSLVVDGGLVSSVDLLWIMTAPQELVNLIVG